jgi:hypothetical protein
MLRYDQTQILAVELKFCTVIDDWKPTKAIDAYKYKKIESFLLFGRYYQQLTSTIHNQFTALSIYSRVVYKSTNLFTMAPLVWLVTGTTSGIGAALVNEIVARGDKVIASGRKADQRLSHLKSDNVAILELDITAGWTIVHAQMEKAWEIFGHIDVLLNNAGASAMRSAEEAE